MFSVPSSCISGIVPMFGSNRCITVHPYFELQRDHKTTEWRDQGVRQIKADHCAARRGMSRKHSHQSSNTTLFFQPNSDDKTGTCALDWLCEENIGFHYLGNTSLFISISQFQMMWSWNMTKILQQKDCLYMILKSMSLSQGFTSWDFGKIRLMNVEKCL